MAKLIYRVETLYKGNRIKVNMFSNKKEAYDFANNHKGLVWQKIYAGKENI
tara:strand:- start:538 stop:690 length:153 start_codon:yes stop_codon:yes gene_type:complete